MANWQKIGLVEELKKKPLQEIKIGEKTFALSFLNNKFAAIDGICNHSGGPLGKGTIDSKTGHIKCPWHNWKYECESGKGEPPYQEFQVPIYALKIESNNLFIDVEPRTERIKEKSKDWSFITPPKRKKGEKIRVLGLSCTNMDFANPRYSTSDALLDWGLANLRNVEVQKYQLGKMNIIPCEGYYSKHKDACTFPCTITQFNSKDEMWKIYKGLLWADVICIATPVRWGQASSLYYKMQERLNAIENQIDYYENPQEDLEDSIALKNKVVCMIVTGGQDNIQSVMGELMRFWGQMGCRFPMLPMVGHSRGWSAEDMDHNVDFIKKSQDLRHEVDEMFERALRDVIEPK